jgi:hypothetical protein
MKSFKLPLFIFAFSYIGFIVAPIFIFGVKNTDVTNLHWTDEGAWASQQIEEIKKSKTTVSAEELDKLYDIVNSQERVQYTFRDVYNIGLNNYLWISWIPVFILFLIFAKSKNDLLYFAGIATFFQLLGLLTSTRWLHLYLLHLLGLYLKGCIRLCAAQK